jgi:hypothetical protein
LAWEVVEEADRRNPDFDSSNGLAWEAVEEEEVVVGVVQVEHALGLNR